MSSGAVPGVPRGDQHARRSGQRLVRRVRCARGRQRGRRRPQHGSRELQLHPFFTSQPALVDGRSRHSPDRHRSSFYQPQQLRYVKGTSGHSTATQGRIAAAHGLFDRTRRTSDTRRGRQRMHCSHPAVGYVTTVGNVPPPKNAPFCSGVALDPI